MCGICGYVGDDRDELIEAMSAAVAHRGPDDRGVWHDRAARATLAHRRLSVLDTSPAGHQPMLSEDGTVAITFNGEIYNFMELRAQLESHGHVFKSRSDTEVLVHLYEQRGVEMLHELNGMFAFGLWDGRRRRLLLARDHAGIKPLYYCHRGEKIYFASEIKALLRIPEVSRSLNRKALVDYLTFLWVPGRQTMLEGVCKLEPGHCLEWQDGACQVRRWFELDYQPDHSISRADWVDRVHDTFLRVVKRQMVSDVPLGAFLSGGTDSSSIVACMRHAYPDRPITCYNVRLDPKESARDHFADDYPYATQVAGHLGVDLKSFIARPDVTDLLPRLIWHLDEPDADPAMILSYIICRSARQDGTLVLLSGTGGDEVFFGYRSHQAFRAYGRLGRMPRGVMKAALAAPTMAASAILGAQNSMVRRLSKFGRGLGETGLRRHLAILDWSTEHTRRQLLHRDIAADGASDGHDPAMKRYYDTFQGRGEINRHSHLLVQTFLAAHNFLYLDKSSMASAVEVRVPFMDLELMRLCARIPESEQLRGGVTKSLLKQAMAPYLPRQVLHRSKTGFMVPLRRWIGHDLGEMIGDLLAPSRVSSRGLFDPAAVQQIIEQNGANRADHAYLIYALLTLELWLQTYVDRAGQAVTCA